MAKQKAKTRFTSYQIFLIALLAILQFSVVLDFTKGIRGLKFLMIGLIIVTCTAND